MEYWNTGKSLVVMQALLAGALALIVGGCDEKPIPGDANRKVEPNISKADKNAGQAKKSNADKPSAAVKDDGDVKLAAQVREALAKEPALKDVTIDVNASAGVVDLFGTVDDTASRVKAGKVAANVPGTTSVKNHLTIVKGSLAACARTG